MIYLGNGLPFDLSQYDLVFYQRMESQSLLVRRAGDNWIFPGRKMGMDQKDADIELHGKIPLTIW